MGNPLQNVCNEVMVTWLGKHRKVRPRTCMPAIVVDDNTGFADNFLIETVVITLIAGRCLEGQTFLLPKVSSSAIMCMHNLLSSFFSLEVDTSYCLDCHFH